MTDLDGESETLFRVREGADPQKTQKVYKLMRLENGKLYPLFIDRDAEAIELGTWYDADSPDLAFLKKMPAGVFLVDAQNGTYTSLEDYKRKRGEKVGKLPSKADVEEASKNGLRWMKITETDRAQRRFHLAGVMTVIVVDKNVVGAHRAQLKAAFRSVEHAQGFLDGGERYAQLAGDTAGGQRINDVVLAGNDQFDRSHLAPLRPEGVAQTAAAVILNVGRVIIK